MKKVLYLLAVTALVTSCNSSKLAPVAKNALKPTVVTQATPHDTDDPAIWINKANPTQSLIIGTDKEAATGGLYAYDLQGKIVNKVYPMDRPNNVDIAYGLPSNGKKVDIAVVTERKKDQIRIFSLPDLKPIDNGGIAVFADSEQKDPMGIALYTNPSNGKIYAIVGRKEGVSGEYLYQYELTDSKGTVTANLVRKFGNYSGKKEIEAIMVDNELGYIYYADETQGIRKYYADPAKGNEELAFFGQKDFKRDHEGIALYKTNDKQGYILISDQQANNFVVYKREGENDNANDHKMIAKIPFSTIECDGADVVNFNFGGSFTNGMLVAMSNGMVFHYYDWNIIQQEIDKQAK
ncbi:phytase [Paenimyroides baculatum]|uniref:Phytase n=1 Tax=Paenimyroides baculatum TaxID=2608000 RepID=A0A5M6CCA2_9FLAO|nr:phytase [Paenimyroides baculatum]KAA5532774.1 phytase [Paenimyroides baculatum]